MVDDSLRDEIVAALPKLRAFATSLTGHSDRADDLVQDTIVRAWGNIDRFGRGTNLNPWLFTILRNLFHSEYRKRKCEVEDADGSYAARLRTHPDQHSRLDFEDFRAALATLPLYQREALLMVGTHGMGYEEAAQVCDVAVGTVEHRVKRARFRLASLLQLSGEADLGPDDLTKAALAMR
jgi:RNA polymerase sigma-70 factor (ECF subfamily)